MNRVAMWGLAPNALSQSNVGVKGNEPFAPGWSFVFQLEAGFDPYSLRLANSPGVDGFEHRRATAVAVDQR